MLTGKLVRFPAANRYRRRMASRSLYTVTFATPRRSAVRSMAPFTRKTFFPSRNSNTCRRFSFVSGPDAHASATAASMRPHTISSTVGVGSADVSGSRAASDSDPAFARLLDGARFGQEASGGNSSTNPGRSLRAKSSCACTAVTSALMQSAPTSFPVSSRMRSDEERTSRPSHL